MRGGDVELHVVADVESFCRGNANQIERGHEELCLRLLRADLAGIRARGEELQQAQIRKVLIDHRALVGRVHD